MVFYMNAIWQVFRTSQAKTIANFEMSATKIMVDPFSAMFTLAVLSIFYSGLTILFIDAKNGLRGFRRAYRQAYRMFRYCLYLLIGHYDHNGSPPVHVGQHLRLPLLCCNRTLQSQDISRIIVGYYKDLLHKKVTRRLRALQADGKLDGFPVFDSRKQELCHYLNNFSRDKIIFRKSLRMLVEDMGLADTSDHHMPIFMTTVKAIITGGRLHVDQETCNSVGAFFLLVLGTDETGSSLIEHDIIVDCFLAHGGADLLLGYLASFRRNSDLSSDVAYLSFRALLAGGVPILSVLRTVKASLSRRGIKGQFYDEIQAMMP